ncbi:MAG: hypothetical protein KDD82_10140 [Planctomycetes bacterium]|nr:hypothetical protein [Planctomycetota bacterium]
MSRGIEFRCPHCSKTVRVPAELAGEAGRCPSCEGMLRVPSMAPNVDLSSQSARTPFGKLSVGQDLPEVERAAPPWIELVAVGLAPLIPCMGLLLGGVALLLAKTKGRSSTLAWFAVGLSLLTGLIYTGIMLLGR